METDNLRSFIALSENTTFKTAAESLFCAQSTLTHRIRKLEKELGVSLVSHTPPYGLTEEGRHLLPSVKAVLQSVEELQQQSERMAQHQKSDVIKVHDDSRFKIPFNYYSQKEKTFLESHPHCRVEHIPLPDQQKLTTLTQKTVDVVFEYICSNATHDNMPPSAFSSFAYKEVKPLRMNFVAVFRKLSDVDALPRSLSDLSNRQLIFSSGQAIQPTLHSLCHAIAGQYHFDPQVYFHPGKELRYAEVPGDNYVIPLFALINTGEIVWPFPEWMKDDLDSIIVDDIILNTYAVYAKDAPSYVQEFVDTIC